MAEETRRKVQEKAAELNYRPNRWARSLVTNRSYLAGMIVPDISHTYYSEITRGAQDVLQAAGYHLLLFTSNREATTERAQIEVLRGSQTEGLLVVTELPDGDLFEQMRREGVSVVLIDRFFEKTKFSHVITDDLKVGYLATEHLIELGHRRIALLAGPDNSAGRLRTKGFKDAMKAHHVPIEEPWIEFGNFRFAESCAAAQRLMKLEHRPTAIMAANDMSAFGAIRGVRDCGFDVPKDVSIIGAGNIEGDQHPNPFLTTVTWDRLAMGREAARSLLDHIGNPKAAVVRKSFEPGVLKRFSTVPP